MRLSVFGLGYVGCVTAACLAKAGHEVTGVDVSETKVTSIRSGRSPIVETGLDDLIAAVVRAGRLTATNDSGEGVDRSDLALICVGTPGRPNGELDVDAISRVGREIGRALRRRNTPYTVVLRSTVLPGTTESALVPALLSGAGPERGDLLRVAVNPEFMREGTSIKDFTRPALTLVGCEDSGTASLLEALYSEVEAPFVQTAIRTAEIVKYVSNAFHALKVCFGNEIGDVCGALGVDAQEVMRIFLMDTKLNASGAYLRPGFAFGGSCLPKDLRAMIHAARRADLPIPLLSAILPSNETQVRRAVDAVLATRKRRVGVVGLAFKSGTDDLRESPMVTLIEALIGKGCDVRVLDRNVAIARLMGANRRYIEEEIPHIASLMCDSVGDLVAHADVVVIGAAGDETASVLNRMREDQTVIDLTRGAAGTPERATAEVEAWCVD